MNLRSAVARINKHGVLLVFPVNNRKEPPSLWSEFHPRTKMRWEWDESGDNKVGDMWMLMKRLSNCRQVVYSKWYQGRATFFSRELFCAMMKILGTTEREGRELSPTSKNLLEILDGNSPLSTKELKREAELVGRFNESTYNRGLRPLFAQLLVVAFGEVEDGAFPSLAIGATKLLYEDLWLETGKMSLSQARDILDRDMPPGSSFRKFFEKALGSR